MAREDLITSLLAQLYDRRPKESPSKNEQLQKIQMTNDFAQLDDAGLVTAMAVELSGLKWGGYIGDLAVAWVSPGWSWGAGQWQ